VGTQGFYPDLLTGWLVVLVKLDARNWSLSSTSGNEPETRPGEDSLTGATCHTLFGSRGWNCECLIVIHMATKIYTCDSCYQPFEKEVKFYNHNVKRGSVNCCDSCQKPHQSICEWCSRSFNKKLSQIKKTKHHFCSQSCFGFWHNAHKKHGTRRSKMEMFLEQRIREEFPSIFCLYNDRETLLTELDFYFPNLRLAIELNGIIHYEPIYGQKTFDRIVNKDKQKIICCYQRGIELITISNFGNFSAKLADHVWQHIKTIIESRILPIYATVTDTRHEEAS